ncbi:MAG: UbiD family decarboxylase [Nitrospinota bacterium]
MPFDDPRNFCEYLEERKELVRIRGEVDPAYEIGAYIRKTSDQQGPALLFENVKGTNMPMVGGVFATRRRILLALESDSENIYERFDSGVKNPLPPRLVDTAPCKEVILRGDDVDLGKFPIPVYSEQDGGAFVTHGIQISKDPEDGTKNASIYRMHFRGKREFSIHAEKHHHLTLQFAKAEAKGQSLEVAVAMGCDPVVMLATQVGAPYGVDELEIAGGLRGKPVDVVKCETVDIEVPATSEIVFEGRLLPHRREQQGPFGEYSGYYGEITHSPVIEVTAITHRGNPVYHAGLTGMPMTENHFLKQIPHEVTLYQDLKSRFRGIQKVHYTAAGCCDFMVFISMKPQGFPGEARSVILAALASPKRPKFVVVVDDDIDVFDHIQVLWAISTRTRPADDLIIIPSYNTPALDPSFSQHELGSALGIDATRPFGRPFADVPAFRGMDRVPDLLALMREGTS